MPVRSCRMFNPLGWWEEPRELKRLVVVGCGPSGIQIIRSLWKDFEVTLVEPKDYYEFTPGILRGLCDPEHLETLQVPLADALAGMNVKHIKGQVIEIGEDHMDLRCQEGLVSLCFDFAVVAVGSRYAGSSLWKVTGEADQCSLEGRRKHLAAMREGLQAMAASKSRVGLLGAGLVGVELAAELVHYFPDLRVVLADKCPMVLPALCPEAQSYAHQWLEEHGVELRLGRELPKDEAELLKTLEVEQVHLCAGVSFHADLVASLGCLDDRQQILTNRFMQCVSPTHVPCLGGRLFALGDCVTVLGTEMNFTKDIYPAEAMANVVVANLRQEPRELPSRLQEMTLCSLGPSDCMWVMNGKLMATGWIAQQLKHQVEVTKMGEMRQEIWGSLVWSMIPHW